MKALEYLEKPCNQIAAKPSGTQHKVIQRGELIQTLSLPLPAGFRALAKSGELPFSLATLIVRMFAWVDIINDCDTPKDMNMTMALRPWLDVENIMTWLNVHQTIGLSASDRIVCLSLFCICCHTLRRFFSSGIMFRLLTELMDLLQNLNPREEAQSDLYIWATIAVAGITVDGTPLRNRGSSVLDSMMQRFPSAPPWDYVEATVKKFLWFRHSLPTWAKCWNAGLERRKTCL